MASQYSFPGVTLLITHYNRSSSLERLLRAFRNLNISFEDVVVADDGSRPEQLDNVKAQQPAFNFRLITVGKNGGIASNINRGQDAVKTPYTLYIQEDFIPTSLFAASLQDALQFMNEDKGLDIVRFWAHYRYPVLKPYGKGFGEMKFSAWNMHHLKFFIYSDPPHLRRSNFFEKFGRYNEIVAGDMAEFMMAISFLQNKGRGLFFEKHSTLLTHENPPDEPSTQARASWRQSKNPVFLILRFLYLRYKWLKCTFHLKFMRLERLQNNK